MPKPSSNSDSNEIAAIRIAEDAKKTVRSWLQWLAGVGAIMLAIVGYFGYADYKSALEKIDEKVDRAVDSKVQEYKRFTDKIIDSVVSAKTEAKDLEKTFAGLETRMQTLETRVKNFQDETLPSLEKQAHESLESFEQSLSSLTIPPEDIQNLQDQRQREFIASSKAYATKLGLNSSDYKIVFENLRASRALAIWDSENRQYKVSLDEVNRPGLPQYIALMGLFLANNFDLCFLKAQAARVDSSFWADFRVSVVYYLILTETGQTYESLYIANAQRQRIFKALKSIEEQTGGLKAGRILALALLKNFKCDWGYENLLENTLSVKKKLDSIPENVVRAAFATF